MKKYLLTYILLFNFSLLVLPQKKKPSLKQRVDSVLGIKPITYKQIDKILKPFQRDSVKVKSIIQKFSSTNYFNGLAYEYIKLGNIYRKYSKYNLAIETHQKALDASKKAKNSEFEIFSLNMLGVDYRRKNIYTSAIDYNKEALEIAEKIKTPNSGVLRSMEVSYNSIGNIYMLLNQYNLAENCFKKAIEIALKSGNKWSLSINNENIAKVKEAQLNIDEAINYTKKALDIDEGINNHYGRMICYNRLGRLYIKKGEYKIAKEYLEEAVPIAKSVKNNYYISLINNNLGWVNTKTNNFSKAKNYFNKSVELAEKRNYKTALTEIYSNLSEYNSLTGNYKEALEFQKKKDAIYKELNNQKTAKYVNDLIAKYDSERKNNQIQKLAKQNEITELKLVRNRNVLIVSIVLLSFLAAILYFWYRQRLLKKEKKIITLEQDVLRSQMNPHFIFNALNSIKQYIISDEQKNAVHYLNKFSKLMRKILENSAIKEVTLAQELETINLYMTIENIRFSNEIDFNISVEQSINLDKIKVPPLVLQPFLENALWHGLSSKKGTKKIDLTIHQTDANYIQIDVEDNGIGRKESAKIKSQKSLNRKSIGIELTKERLRNFVKDCQNSFSLLYKDLKDEKDNALGTKVLLLIPLK
ncbi:MAG: tetratricopeptide repeat-containing sensor histidine kinase [Flavobacteriaceae bacterium]